MRLHYRPTFETVFRWMCYLYWFLSSVKTSVLLPVYLVPANGINLNALHTALLEMIILQINKILQQLQKSE